MAINLTGVPSAAGDLGMLGVPNQLSPADVLRKKKLMSAAMSDQAQTATQFLTGNGTAFSAGGVRAALGMPY